MIGNAHDERTCRIACLWVSVALYCASLALPVITFTGDRGQTHPGYEALILGWALKMPFTFFIWLANPLWFFSILLLLRKFYAFAGILCSLALICALLTLHLFSGTYLCCEDGSRYGQFAPAPGMYLWLASLIVPLYGAAHLYRLTRKQRSL